jgi:hypothetical protein
VSVIDVAAAPMAVRTPDDPSVRVIPRAAAPTAAILNETITFASSVVTVVVNAYESLSADPLPVVIPCAKS